RRAEYRGGQPWEDRVGSAEIGLVGDIDVDQVVERAIDGPQAERHADVRKYGDKILTGGMAFGDMDLVEDEVQVAPDEVDPGASRNLRVVDKRHQRRRGDRNGDNRIRRRRECLLGDAVLVLIKRPDTQPEPSEAKDRIYREGRAVRARKADADAARLEDDVREHTRPGNKLFLPDIGGVGDGTGGVGDGDIIRIRDAGDRHSQQLTFGRRSVHSAGDAVENG